MLSGARIGVEKLEKLRASEHGRRRIEADRRAKAGPLRAHWIVAQFRPRWVPYPVPDAQEQPMLRLESSAPITPAEAMIDASEVCVRRKCQPCVQLAHTRREPGRRDLHDQVIVVLHERPREDAPRPPRRNTVELRQEERPQLIVEDGLFVVAASDNVVERARVLITVRARHARTVRPDVRSHPRRFTFLPHSSQCRLPCLAPDMAGDGR